MGQDPMFLLRDLRPEEKGHPQIVMKNLGFHAIKSVPQSIADAWYFLCDEYPDEYPEYIREIHDYPFERYKD